MNKVVELTAAEQIGAEASDWLTQMDADQKLSEAELLALKQWMNRSPAHRAELNRLIAFWQQANVLTELSFPLHKKPVANTGWSSIISWQSVSAVATVMVVAVMMALNFDNLSSNQPRVAANGVYETRIGEQNAITLVDGSVIELNTNSRVQVNYTDQRRAIQLMQGEAFFDVSKDPSRPFEVSAGKGVVRAVGTAFAVRFNKQALTVTVTEGKVALAAATALQESLPSNDFNTVVTNVGALVAGQRAEFEPLLAQALDTSTHALKVEPINNSLAWRKGLLMFNGESLATVVNEMNRYTVLTIEIADPGIADLQIGGQFKVAETEAMLRNLSVSFGLDIHHVDEHLVQLVKKK